ncbi:hypothetical protein OB905_08400 [Halobacteria archaeon AArc-dxtr1]|nr:hypothetical protein [Halobacteria archaeon AArc-dxtr1]
MLERERLIEIVVSVVVVLVMIGAMLSIGSTYGGENGTLSPEGGELLVLTIVGFILLLVGVGVALAFTMNEPEDGSDADASSAGSSTGLLRR